MFAVGLRPCGWCRKQALAAPAGSMSCPIATSRLPLASPGSDRHASGAH